MRITVNARNVEKVQREINSLVIKLSHARKYWEQIGIYMQRQTLGHFKREETPDGEKWKSLSPETVKRRMKRHKRGRMKILQDTGEHSIRGRRKRCNNRQQLEIRACSPVREWKNSRASILGSNGSRRRTICEIFDDVPEAW